MLTPDEKHFVAVNAPASEANISPVEMSTLKEKLEKLDVRDLPADDSDPLRSILSLIDLGALLFLALGGDIRRRGVPCGQDLKGAGDFP